MSQKLSRKEIKRDQFREVMEQILGYAGSHVRHIALALGGGVVVILLTVAVFVWWQARQTQAQEAFNRALTVYQATIDAEDPAPDDPWSPRFASEEARRERAKELFTEVWDGYGGSQSGRLALVYLGRIALDEGDTETARQRWRTFVEAGDDTVLVSETHLNLIALERQEGRAEEVAQKLETMLDQPNPGLPRDALLFELGSTYEALGREQQALDSYRRLVEEFRSSMYVQEAQQRMAALGGATPPRQPRGGALPTMG